MAGEVATITRIVDTRLVLKRGKDSFESTACKIPRGICLMQEKGGENPNAS